MSSKRRLRRNSCTKKTAYTQHEAESVAHRMTRQGIIVHAYMCNFGSHWHVGHRPNKLTRLIDDHLGLTSSKSVGRFKRL